MENKIPAYLLSNEKTIANQSNVRPPKLMFLDKTLLNAANAVQFIYEQAENSTSKNFMYRINPKVKLIALLYLIVIISIATSLTAQITTTGFILILYLLAKFQIVKVYKKVLFLAFFFGFLVAFPASLNVISNGEIIFNLITFDKPIHFWIYTIPQHIGITTSGVQVVTLLFLRVLNSISFALFIVFTTSFPALVKSFKIIGVPDMLLMIVTLAYKFIFILCRTIEATYFALKSRLLGNLNSSKIRDLVSGRVFFIFKKSMSIYENTYYAMVSRGYSGKVILYRQKTLKTTDFVALFIIGVFGIIILLI